MKAARVMRFGPPNVIINDDLPRPGKCWSAHRRQRWAIGTPSSVRARLNSNPCRLFSVPSYRESSKRSERRFRDPNLAMKYTTQRATNSAGHTRNMRYLRPERWRKTNDFELDRVGLRS